MQVLYLRCLGVRRARIDHKELHWRPIGSDAVVDSLVADAYALHGAFHPFEQPIPFHVVEAAPQDGAYAAINQAISGAVALKEQAGDAAIVVIPAVLVDGPLFTVTYEDMGAEFVEETDFQRVHWGGSTALGHSTIVVLITRRALEEGASQLRFDVGELAPSVPMNL